MADPIKMPKDPAIEFDFEGAIGKRIYNPFEVLKKIEASMGSFIANPTGSPTANQLDAIRSALGFATDEEVEKAPADAKPFTISDYSAWFAYSIVMETIDNLAASKKLRELTQK